MDLSARARPRRAGRNRGEVLAASARVIARRGVEATRFADVSAEAGVPISTLQYYFGSREDMILATLDHAWQAEREDLVREAETAADPWERIRRLVTAGIGGFAADDDLRGRLWLEGVRLGVRDPGTRAEVLGDYQSWRALLAHAVRAGEESGAFSPSMPADDVAVVALAMIDGVGLALALDDPQLPGSPESIVLQALEVLLGSLSDPRPGSSVR